MANQLSALANAANANIKAEMARRGVAQADIADVLGLSRDSIGRRRSGALPWQLDEIDAVARFLEVSPNVLTRIDEDTPQT